MSEDQYIEINLEDPEDSYIYYSICDYSEAIVDQIDKDIKELCNFCGSCKKSYSPKELVPLQSPEFTELKPSNTSKRIRTEHNHIKSKIKRLDSNEFSNFLQKDIDPNSTIKDINREIILKLQSISEDPFRTMLQPVNPVQLHIEKITLSYINYTGRSLVVLPIPNDSKSLQIIFNSDGKWCPNGGI